MKVSELEGWGLDYWVARAEGIKFERKGDIGIYELHGNDVGGYNRHEYSPSTDWARGGPIIEREWITLGVDTLSDGKSWCARVSDQHGYWTGPTPLIGAMRAFVASKLGEEVEG